MNGTLTSSCHSILFQRGVYPREDFRISKKYGIPLFVTTNPELKDYIDQIISQVRGKYMHHVNVFVSHVYLLDWMKSNKISKLILVIKSRETGQVLERWQFDVHVVQQVEPVTATEENPEDMEIVDNSVNESTRQQIRALMRQISASVTFLPELDQDDCK